jgi:hypothetical protein
MRDSLRSALRSRPHTIRLASLLLATAGVASVVGTCTPSVGGDTSGDTTGIRATGMSPDTIASPGQNLDTEGPGPSLPQGVLVEAIDVRTWSPGNPAACGLSAPAPQPTSVVIYFACNPPGGPFLPAVPARRVRIRAGADPKVTAVAALLAGPTEAERRAGYVSRYGPATASVSFTLRTRGDTAFVEFDRSLANVPRIFVGDPKVAELVATLGQFPDVRWAVVRIGGEPLCRAAEAC